MSEIIRQLESIIRQLRQYQEDTTHTERYRYVSDCCTSDPKSTDNPGGKWYITN